jgi:DNA polymerase III epsilon subunit-like protein
MRFLFIDVETNDHPSKRFELRIVTITWIIAQPNSFVEKMENLIVKPVGFRIAPGATRVHGVTEDQAQKYGRPVSDVLGRLVHDLQSFADLTIVGHKVDFDIKVVGAELSRNGFGFDIFALPFICTMQIGKSVCRIPRASGNGYKYPTLQELYLHLFRRHFADAHTSKADAEATARCFFELMRRGALPDLKTQMPRREPRDSKVRQHANASKGNSSAAGTPMQTAHVQDRIVVTSDYLKEEEGYRQHIKEIIREGGDKGGLLANSRANSIEKEPKDRMPTRAASQTVEQVVSSNPAMPESAPHAKQTFPPIGTLDGCGTALVPGIRGTQR